MKTIYTVECSRCNLSQRVGSLISKLFAGPLVAVLLSAIAGCSSSDDKMVDVIWTAYKNYPGNSTRASRDLHVEGKIIAKGTVAPSALNSSSSHRLPAYLACYTYTMVMEDYGDTQSDMCIYYVDNPYADTHGVLWRGQKYLDQLKSKMQSDDFSPE